MAFLDKIIRLKDKEFNLLRKFFFPANLELKLLKVDDTDEVGYSVVMEIESDWFLEYSKNDRRQVNLQYAGTQADFQKKFVQSSHISINGDVYQIMRENFTKPLGRETFWTIPCELTGETFTED